MAEWIWDTNPHKPIISRNPRLNESGVFYISVTMFTEFILYVCVMKRNVTLLLGLFIFQTTLLAQQMSNPSAVFQWNKLEKQPNPSKAYLGKNNFLADSISLYGYDNVLQKFFDNPSSVRHPVYDSEGRVIEEITQYKTSPMKIKAVMTYDSYGLVEQTDYLWNETLNDWENYTRYVYGRNDEGIDTSIVFYEWNASAGVEEIVFGGVNSYTTDSLGRVVSINLYDYVQNVGWVPESRSTLNYEGLDSIPKEFISESYLNNEWQLDERIYNITWKIETRFSFFSSEPVAYFTDKWQDDKWNLAFYDSNTFEDNRWINKSTFEYVEQDSSWELSESFEMVYDERGNIIQQLFLDYYGGISDTSIFESSNYVYGANDELLVIEKLYYSDGSTFGSKEVYHYSSTGMTDLMPVTYTLFPNPVQSGSTVNIEGKPFLNVILYDLQGRKIGVYKPEGNQSVCLEGVGPGLYLLQIHFENGRTAQSRISVY